MKTKNYKIYIDSRNIFQDLERESYIMNNLKDLISFMVEQNITDWPQFQQYHKELTESMLKYEQFQNTFQEFIQSKLLNSRETLLNWNLKFHIRELTYTVSIED